MALGLATEGLHVQKKKTRDVLGYLLVSAYAVINVNFSRDSCRGMQMVFIDGTGSLPEVITVSLSLDVYVRRRNRFFEG